MKKFYSFILISFLSILISCSDDDSISLSPQNSTDVYVAGQMDNNACYWKNNVLTMLDVNGFSNTNARKIIVHNNNVYILGADNSGINSDNNFLYWKNGVLTNLNNTFAEADYDLNFITDMTVINDDIYFVGYLRNSINPEIYDLVYWKNGIKTIVVQNCVGRNLESSIKVVNNDVYIFSSIGINQTGVFINNTFNEINSYLKYGMAVNGNDVYIYGSINSTTGFYTNITTGNEIILPYRINSLIFDVSDVYTVVDYNNQSYRRMIQKNNTPYYISPEGFESHILSLKVLNGSVYTIVRELTSNDFGPNKLLINNIPELVVDYTEGQSDYMNSVYVVQN